MLKLMKLEMKKVKMWGYIKGAIIANIVIIALLAVMIFASKNEGNIEFTSLTFGFSFVDSMVKATFIIFASVLIAKFIIEE